MSTELNTSAQFKYKKDQHDNNDEESPHTQYKSGRKNLKPIDKGIEIWDDHHQTLRSKQFTPKFFRNPPTHPGQKPNDNEPNSHILTQWNKKAKNLLNTI